MIPGIAYHFNCIPFSELEGCYTCWDFIDSIYIEQLGDLQDPKMELRSYHISGHRNWGYIPLGLEKVDTLW